MKIFLMLWPLLLAFAWGKSVSHPALTLYFIPSPFGIDWSTPRSLALTAAKNKFRFKSHFMGHVWVEVECEKSHILSGMVGDRPDYFTQLFINQRGLSILYHSFPGRLEKKEDILKEREELYQEGRINFVKFILNSSQCQRALDYYQTYKDLNLGRHYGLANRPRHQEGSGCSAFGASFLDILNLIGPEITSFWSHTINIPNELLGPPLYEEGVNMMKILLHSKRWAQEHEAHKKLFFWDPDKMFQWVNLQLKAHPLQIEQRGNAQGIIFDKSFHPLPPDPIWMKRE